MFKTTGVIDRDFYKKNMKYTIPLVSRIIVVVCIVGYIGSFIRSFDSMNYVSAAVSLLVILAFCFAYFLGKRKSVDLSIAKLKETTGMDEVEFTVYFDDDGVVTEDNSSRSPGRIKYSDFKKIVKTKSCYLIFTKARHVIPVFVNCLSDEEKASFLAFLKERAPQVKC